MTNEIDWARPAAHIAELVRGDLPPWTSSVTVTVTVALTIDAVHGTDLPDSATPAGTVLDTVPDGILVQTGCGILRVEARLNPAGALDTVALAGRRLGSRHRGAAPRAAPGPVAPAQREALLADRRQGL